MSENLFVGNIRVFCRIRPLLHSESISSIEHVGTDGSVMVCDPVKPQSAHKIFQFNKVFGPTTTQGKSIVVQYIFL
jgi:kinesin family member C2/C3